MGEVAIITKAQMDATPKGGTINGICLIKSYSAKKTKNNKDYVDGVIQVQGGAIYNFKVWSGTNALTELTQNYYENTTCNISGSVEEYQNMKQLVITNVVAVNDVPEDTFFVLRYNRESYVAAFKQILASSISAKGLSVYDAIVTPEIFESFADEFAAKSHHDNCKTGLLAHTYKMLQVACWVSATYPMLVSDRNDNGVYEKSQDKVDLLILGIALHDIGKIVEMHYGNYTEMSSYVGHTIFGAEMLVEHKDLIVNSYSEQWYYELLAILVQHHGEFETPCKSIMAFVIHNIDMLDATFTGISQDLESNAVIDASGVKIKRDGKYLAL